LTYWSRMRVATHHSLLSEKKCT